MSNIAVVVPTCREERMSAFADAWRDLIRKHQAQLIWVIDGDTPKVFHDHRLTGKFYDPMILDMNYVFGIADDPLPINKDNEQFKEMIFNRTDAVRNLGFVFAANLILNRNPDSIIITLDDDVEPIGDPIQDHLDILSQRVPISWMSSTQFGTEYMRGFPYGVRDEAEVVMSHGIWTHVPDLDAVTQLKRPDLIGGFLGPFYRGPVPRGVYMPICGMNVAFKMKALPYVYWSPMGPKAMGLGRWADIWMGVTAKDYFDEFNWAIFTGGAPVRHTRASNVWKNLEAEVTVLEMHESFWKQRVLMPGGENVSDRERKYRKLYRDSLGLWQMYFDKIGLMDAEGNDVSNQTLEHIGLQTGACGVV